MHNIPLTSQMTPGKGFMLKLNISNVYMCHMYVRSM